MTGLFLCAGNKLFELSCQRRTINYSCELAGIAVYKIQEKNTQRLLRLSLMSSGLRRRNKLHGHFFLNCSRSST